MASQGIMAQGASQLMKMAGSRVNPTASKKASDSGSFEAVMGRNLKSAEKSQSAPKEVSNPRQEKPADNTLVSKDIKDPNAQNMTKDEPATLQEIQTPGKEEQVADDKPSIEEIANAALGKIKSKLCDILGLSEEELASIMESLGLTMVDLLQPEGIKQLVMAVNGTEDASCFLTDEAVAKQYSELLSTLHEVVEKTGVSEEILQKAAKNVAVPENNQIVKTEEEPEETDTKFTFEAVKLDENDEPVKLNSGSDSKQQSSFSKPEQSTSQAEQFLQHLTKEGAVTLENAEQQAARTSQLREIANQIIEQVKVVIKPGQTSMEMQLNPEQLGRVNLNITAKNGVLTAQFTTQDQVAKEAIESQVQTLKETLELQGFKVEAIEVTVSEFGFQKNGGTDSKDEQSGNKTRKRGFNSSIGESPAEEEPEQQEAYDGIGSSINYMV